MAKDARFQHSVQEAKFVGTMLVHVVTLVCTHRQSLEKVSRLFQVVIGSLILKNDDEYHLNLNNISFHK